MPIGETSAEKRRPLADRVFVEDAEIVSYVISFTYYLQNGRNKSSADVGTAVQEAV